MRRIGRADAAAARHELGFARRPALELLVRRRDAGRAHEGAVRDAHARKLRRNGELARDLPVRDEVIVEELGQEAAAGGKAGPAVMLGHDLQVFDLEQVAGRRAFYEDRAGERMGNGAFEALEVLCRGTRADLEVVRVARLERELLARPHLDDRRDVGMPAIVAGVRLIAQALCAVDGDRFHAQLANRPPTAYPQAVNRTTVPRLSAARSS